ncbi:alkaline phosphatase [bacterium]|nr:MAG: alkaline phosphatase [bacterium]
MFAPLLAYSPPPEPAPNVILMIADGCGYNSYAAGAMAEGRLGREIFNGRGWNTRAMSTYPLRTEKAPGGTGQQDPNLVYDPAKAWDKTDGYKWLTDTPTDSGASATVYSTGEKTYRHSICWSDLDKPMVNAYDRFQWAGKSVGVVTSVEWSDATPAAMIAHNRNREDHVEIAREMTETSQATVIMGACHPWFDGSGKRSATMGDASWVGNRDIFVKPMETWNGIRLIETKADFQALAEGKLDMKGCTRVIGTAQVAGGLQVNRATRDWNGDGKTDGEDNKAAPLFGDPRNTTVPELGTMATGALNLLSKNQKGFFLMVEGGAVDHANHFNWPSRSVEEALDFFRTVETVSGWIEKHGGWKRNLLIVTTDHECGFVLGPNSDKVPFEAIVDNGIGKTPGMRHNSGGHTNALVPVFARGAGAEQLKKFPTKHDPVRGDYIDNTDLGRLLRD